MDRRTDRQNCKYNLSLSVVAPQKIFYQGFDIITGVAERWTGGADSGTIF